MILGANDECYWNLKNPRWLVAAIFDLVFKIYNLNCRDSNFEEIEFCYSRKEDVKERRPPFLYTQRISSLKAIFCIFFLLDQQLRPGLNPDAKRLKLLGIVAAMFDFGI